MKTEHDKNCMLNCEEDLSGICDCGFEINNIRCGNCGHIYSYRVPEESVCLQCGKGCI